MKLLDYHLIKFSKFHCRFFCHFEHNVTGGLTQFGGPMQSSTSMSQSSSIPIISSAKSVALLISNCTDLKQLRQIFAHLLASHFLELYPNSFHFNNISRIFSRLESPREALHVYISMRRAGISPDKFTLPIVMKAAGQILNLNFAEQVHATSIKFGLEHDLYCQSGLISFYSKAGELQKARTLFMNCKEKKLGSWNAIIGGLSQGGCGREAIKMFILMMSNGLSPDDISMVSITSACGSLGDLNLALQLHKFVFQVKDLKRSNILMMNSVIDMYGKCGRMDLAHKAFLEMEEKNVSSWTSMIVGYATHGHVRDALNCFEYMIEAGVRPNQVTFVGVLSACVHGGLVQEGKYYFNMIHDCGIKPVLPHYGCMVDVLGRAGLLDEAKMLVESMPMKANVVIWGCLMGACEKHGNVKMGEWVGKHLIELEPWNDGVFVALSNIYASHSMWKEVEKCRTFMKNRKLDKVPAYSLPESYG